MRHHIEVVIDRLAAGPTCASPVGRSGGVGAEAGRRGIDCCGGGRGGRRKPGQKSRRRKLKRRREGKRTAKRSHRDPHSPSAYPTCSVGSLCLHALRTEFRAAQSAIVQLQQSAGNVHAVRWAGRNLQLRSGSAGSRIPICRLPRGRLNWSARGETWGAGGGTFIKASPTRSSDCTSLKPGTMLETPWRDLDPQAAEAVAVRHRRSSTSRSPGAAVRRE